MAEWLKAHDSKSCMRKRIAGSNPVSSAIRDMRKKSPTGIFLCSNLLYSYLVCAII